MKKVLIVICLINLFFFTNGSAQKLTIIEGDYDKAKREAINQNKLLIIDFYTTWCGPCKVLDKLVFKDSLMSSTIAKNFVVLKYNAEVDTIFNLTKKHHVAMYPTNISLNKDFRVIKKLIGTGVGDDIFRNYKLFLDDVLLKHKNNNYIIGVSSSINLSFPDFYSNLINRKVKKVNQLQMKEFWEQTTDYLSEVPFIIFSYFNGANEKVNSFFFKNKQKYEELYGELDVKFVTVMLIYDSFDKALKSKDDQLFNKSIGIAKEHLNAKDTASYLYNWRLRKLQSEDKWQDALTLFVNTNEAKDGFNVQKNRFSQEVLEECNDKMVLNQCIKWMKETVDKFPETETLSIYAKLLLKSGNKTKAIETMRQVVSLAQQNKEDTKDFEKWIRANP